MQITFFLAAVLDLEHFFTVDTHLNSSVYACMHVEICLFPANTHGAKQHNPFLLIEMTGLGMV